MTVTGPTGGDGRVRCHRPWDGQLEEGTIHRPGFSFPWVYVVTADDPSGYAWGIYSQHGPGRPVRAGHADELDEARAAVAAAELPTGRARRR